MYLKDLVILKEQGENVAERLDIFYKEEMESDDICLEFGAVYDDAISYDCDFEELMQLLKVKFVQIIENGKDLGFKYNNYIYLYDGETQVLVPFVDEKNRHDEDLPDETFVFFNKIIEITADKYLICDECGRLFLRDSLINLDPVNERGNEFKEEYKGYDSMICGECYNNMAN